MASVIILTYPDRAGAEELAKILRELGVTAVAVPEEDEPGVGSMVWQVRVSEADAGHVKALIRAIQPGRLHHSSTSRTVIL